MHTQTLAILCGTTVMLSCGPADERSQDSGPDGGALDAAVEPVDAADADDASADADPVDGALSEPTEAGVPAVLVVVDFGKVNNVPVNVARCDRVHNSSLVLQARSANRIPSLVVTCEGDTMQPGTYEASDPYLVKKNLCSVVLVWEVGDSGYDSVGVGSIAHEIVAGHDVFTLESIKVHSYKGPSEGRDLTMSGTFTCPSTSDLP